MVQTSILNLEPYQQIQVYYTYNQQITHIKLTNTPFETLAIFHVFVVLSLITKCCYAV